MSAAFDDQLRALAAEVQDHFRAAAIAEAHLRDALVAANNRCDEYARRAERAEAELAQLRANLARLVTPC